MIRIFDYSNFSHLDKWISSFFLDKMYNTYVRIFAQFILILVLLVIGMGLDAMGQGRTVIPINSDWEFMYGYEKRAANTRPVTLPHTWNVAEADSGVKNYYRGEGSYEKELFIPQVHQGKRLFLHFEGVSTIAWVLINGNWVGEHRGGYSAFTMEITDQVIYGEKNTLLVKVSNAYQLDVLPLGGDFTKYGGIYRPVSLLVTDQLCITPLDYGGPGVYLTNTEVSKEEAIIEVKVKVSNGVQSKERIKAVIKVTDVSQRLVQEDMHMATLAPNKTSTLNRSIVIKNPHLWQGKKDPYCYQVEISIYKGNQLLDHVIQPLGIRSFTIDTDRGFFLNGQYVDLHGVNRHQDKAGKGSALSWEDHKQDMDLIMEMGANIVRLSHYQQSQAIFDYADTTGLVLWAEVPFVGQGGYRNKGYFPMESLHENGRQQLKELIRQNYNHPSVCFWGLFNELKDLDGNPLRYLYELQKLAKKEDPIRFTVAATNIDTSQLNNVTDLIAWNKYYGWYGETPAYMGSWADEMHRAFPNRSMSISEYGAGGSLHHHEDTLIAPNPGGRWHPEGWQAHFHEENWRALYDRPFIWGKMIWNMFDFSSSMRDEGDRPGINDKGLVTFDRMTKKDAFYFYKANWNDQPMVYIADRRFTERTKNATIIKAYGNLETIELVVNGESKGSQIGNLGIYKWEDIVLKTGKNIIQIQGQGEGRMHKDECVWFYTPKVK